MGDEPEQRIRESGLTEDEGPAVGRPRGRTTRSRTSGAELEARFDQWREARRTRRTARTPVQAARGRRRIVAAVLGAGILALVLVQGVTTSRDDREIASNEERISALALQVRQATAVPVDDRGGERLATTAEAASTAGRAVATEQQAFADLYRRATTEPGPGDGSPNQAALDMVRHRQSLAPFFDPNTFIARDSEVSVWQNVAPYEEATQIDPRYAWYVRYDGVSASPATASTWTLETVTPVLDTKRQLVAPDEVTVVWLCRDAQTGAVLAWARSRFLYDAAARRGSFGRLELNITTRGAEHQQQSTADPRLETGSGTSQKDAGGR